VSKTKRNVLLLLLFAALLIAFLAMSLPDLTLAPSRPVPPAVNPLEAGSVSSSSVGGRLLSGLIAIVVTGLAVLAVYSISVPERRKRLAAMVLLIAALLLGGELLRRFFEERGILSRGDEAGGGSLVAPGETVSSPASSSEPPQWLEVLVVLAVSALVVIVGIALIGMARRRASSGSAHRVLAAEARSAVTALESGGDLRSTILRCYREMSRVLQHEQGIEREAAMTPREFERRLIDLGLPERPLQILTRLFEEVRYGSVTATPQQEELAVLCLTDIADSCQALGDARE